MGTWASRGGNLGNASSRPDPVYWHPLEDSSITRAGFAARSYTTSPQRGAAGLRSFWTHCPPSTTPPGGSPYSLQTSNPSLVSQHQVTCSNPKLAHLWRLSHSLAPEVLSDGSWCSGLLLTPPWSPHLQPYILVQLGSFPEALLAVSKGGVFLRAGPRVPLPPLRRGLPEDEAQALSPPQQTKNLQRTRPGFLPPLLD